MYLRDLFVGLLLFGGAGWIASVEGVGSQQIALGVAVAGCALAGSIYLLSAADIGTGRRVAGRTLTRLRFRAVAQIALGTSLLALGGDGYVGGGTGSPLIAGAGVAVIGVGLVVWIRPTETGESEASVARGDESAVGSESEEQS